MTIQIIISAVLSILIVSLIICIILTRKSNRKIKNSVMWMVSSLITPLLGNLIIININSETIAYITYHIYYISTNIVLLALLNFTEKYCVNTNNIIASKKKHRRPILLYVILYCDILQLALNCIFNHVFHLEETLIDGSKYYDATYSIGMYIHMGIHYLIFTACILIFIIFVTKSPKIFKEKYAIVLLALTGVAIWQTLHVILHEPINTSMIGYGLFGIMLYCLTIVYRPMRLLDHMLSNIASNMPSAMILYDPNNQCIWINKKARILLNLNNNQLDKVNETLKEILGDLTEFSDNNNKRAMTNREVNGRYYIITKQTTTDDKNKTTGYILTIKDDTNNQTLLQKEAYNANHDELTGLYNKSYLYRQIEERVKQNTNNDYLIIFTNIRNFKLINDIFGSTFGDNVIKDIANFIKNNTTKNCIYGRLTGDTFGILSPKKDFDPQKIEKKLSEYTININTFEYRILIHLGIYEITEENINADIMMDRAKLALASISDQYNTHIAYYNDTFRKSVLYSQQITTELENALKSNQIIPYLQPIMNADNKIIGAEALVRWIHPEKGFMPPGDFIPIFEKNGMIIKIDCYIWRKACEILAKWNNDIFISINISPRDFYYIDVVEYIKSLAKEYKIDPHKLRIEIVESVMISDSDDRMKDLEKFRKAGFIVEMDDFGSGYSSLNLLKNMPVDILKIDMMFLSKSDNNNRAAIIIKNIINLANELNITTLTEGVETKEQFDFLSNIGCDLFQGYYFNKPLPIDMFEKEYIDK